MLTSESKKEFDDARRQAFIEEMLSFFTGRSTDLLSFDEIQHKLRLQDASYKGLQEIELDKIVGSVGRYRDFTRTFLPKRDEIADRWRRVDEVAHTSGYPPIEVYKVGDVYFVRDGNHRVSVARQHNAKTIEAYVIEYKTPVPITSADELNDILLKAERARFLEKTNLDQIRPGHNVEFTEPGRYRLVREHIAFHKYLKETECGCEIPYEEAVASWYDNVYMPVIRLIRERGVMKHFPGRTEADLYAWILLHRAELESRVQKLGAVSTEDILDTVTLEKSPNPLRRLMGYFRRQLDLQNLPLQAERKQFLDDTQIDQLRPGHGIECTEPGCYQLLREHISTHKYLKETELQTEIPFAEAVTSWYDNVYQPVVQKIMSRGVLQNMAGRTATDLYLYVTSRRAALEENKEAVQEILDEAILQEIEQESQAISPIGRLMQFLGRVFAV